MEVSSPELIHEVLESIVLLTEQRDQRSLEQSLFRTLGEMLEGVEYQVLEFEDKGDHRVIHTTQQGHALPERILNRVCEMANGERAHAIALDDLHYLPIDFTVRDLTAKRMLVLWRPVWDNNDTRLALGMVRVYINFTRLLYDSEKDTLTGLYNRKRLERRLAELSNAHLNSRRQEDRFGRGEFLALLDMDHFKKVNDTHGHLIGDEVLIIFANILRESLRESDMCFRFGGEEFLVLLHDVNREHVQAALERLRHNVASHDFPQVGKVTVSIGFSAIDCQRQPAHLSIAEADRALYFAKGHGRDQVREYQALHQALLAAGLLEPPQLDGALELF